MTDNKQAQQTCLCQRRCINTGAPATVTHQIKVSSHFKVHSGHKDAHIPGACLIVGVKIGHSTKAFAESLFIEIVERGDFSYHALVSA